MRSENKALELFKLVMSLTEENKMDWSASERSDDIFEATTSSGSKLTAFPFTTQEGIDEPPSLTVYDADDKMIFDITSELEGLSVQELRDFYSTVRARVLNVDEKLQAVIDDLTNLKVRAF